MFFLLFVFFIECAVASKHPKLPGSCAAHGPMMYQQSVHMGPFYRAGGNYLDSAIQTISWKCDHTEVADRTKVPPPFPALPAAPSGPPPGPSLDYEIETVLSQTFTGLTKKQITHIPSGVAGFLTVMEITVMVFVNVVDIANIGLAFTRFSSSLATRALRVSVKIPDFELSGTSAAIVSERPLVYIAKATYRRNVEEFLFGMLHPTKPLPSGQYYIRWEKLSQLADEVKPLFSSVQDFRRTYKTSGVPTSTDNYVDTSGAPHVVLRYSDGTTEDVSRVGSDTLLETFDGNGVLIKKVVYKKSGLADQFTYDANGNEKFETLMPPAMNLDDRLALFIQNGQLKGQQRGATINANEGKGNPSLVSDSKPPGHDVITSNFLKPGRLVLQEYTEAVVKDVKWKFTGYDITAVPNPRLTLDYVEPVVVPTASPVQISTTYRPVGRPLLFTVPFYPWTPRAPPNISPAARLPVFNPKIPPTIATSDPAAAIGGAIGATCAGFKSPGCQPGVCIVADLFSSM